MSPGTRLPSLEHGAKEDRIPRGSVDSLLDVFAATPVPAVQPASVLGTPELSDPGAPLLSRMLETVTSFVSASIALGLQVDERQIMEPVVVRGAHAGDADAAATLIRRLPDLEPIDPFNPRRAEAAGSSVMWAADAGGPEQAAASMYGRHLRRHGYGVPVAMYFRREGRIVSGLTLLRTVDSPPFAAHEVELLLELQPFLETTLAFTGAQAATSAEVLSTAGLTSREAEVARLVGGGLSNAGIAGALGMSEATVKAHLTRVYTKLGVRSRLQLAVMLPRFPHMVRAAVEVGAA